jgi:hypothetical protein
MATSPAAFVRFLSDNIDLVLAIFERGDVDEAELIALVARHRSDDQAGTEHLRAQIEGLGVVERTAHAQTAFELSHPVLELLTWLTRRQRLSSATVLRAYLDDLSSAERELGEAIQARDASTAALALKDLDGLVERVRTLSDANRDSIVTEAQALRSAGSDVSAVDRFQAVRRLWDRYLEPLRQLVCVRGEMEQRLGGLHQLLAEGEQVFVTHGAVQRAFSRAASRLARMRRAASEDHHAAVVEVAPLYERLRRDSRWVLGASRALGRLRAEGATALDLDRRMGLTGWRTRYLMSDDELRARLAGLVGYRPEGPVALAAPPPPADVALITREELRAALAAAAPVHDVLALVLERWPDRPLGSQLRAFGQVAGGRFGPVAVTEGTRRRDYAVPAVRIEAWPLTLEEVET